MSKSFYERLNLPLIDHQFFILTLIFACYEDSRPTDWKKYIEFNTAAIADLDRRFKKIYADEDPNLALFAYFFKRHLAEPLEDLKKFSETPGTSRNKVLVMTRLQAEIITWKQQLEKILREIEKEQAEATDKPA